MNVFKMAWRNVWRNGRRSVVTIAAMTFSLWVLLLYSGLISGYMQSMRGEVLDMEVGDMQIFHPDYLDRPSMYAVVEAPEALLASLDAAGYPASARLLGGGLAAAGEYSSGVQFRGIDPARDAKVSLVNTRVVDGAWLDPADAKGVVVGRRLARTLVVKPGDELVVLSQATDGSMANDLFQVRGILGTVGDGTDRAGIFMNAALFREFFLLPEGTHQIIVRTPPEVALADGAAVVTGLAGEATVRTWRELMPFVAQMLDSTAGMIYFIFFVVYIAIGILILNAMLMAVFERIKEFGVLKAIGMEPFSVLSLILVEAFIEIGLAVGLGVLLALPAMGYLTEVGIDVGVLGGTSIAGVSMPAVWHGVYTPQTVAGPIVMLVIMAGAAVLYPAIKAAMLKPIDAMRHQ